MLKVPCAQVGFMKFNIVVVYDKENNLLIFHESAMQKYAKSTDINSSVQGVLNNSNKNIEAFIIHTS